MSRLDLGFFTWVLIFTRRAAPNAAETTRQVNTSGQFRQVEHTMRLEEKNARCCTTNSVGIQIPSRVAKTSNYEAKQAICYHLPSPAPSMIEGLV